MKPPDLAKRPSARPSARSSSLPPAQDSQGSPVEAASSTEVVAAAEPSRSEPKAAPKRTSAKRKSPARAAALRSPVADMSPSASSVAAPAMGAAESQTPEQRVTPASDPQESTPVREVEHADDDGDIFGDSGAVPMAALSSYPRGGAGPGAQQLSQRPVRGRDRLTKSSRGERKRDEVAMVGSAQQLDSSDYYFRQYGAHAIRSLSAEVDDFGLDPHFEERARPALEALVKRYFRVDVHGAERLPASGRALIVANHAGVLPWDGLVLRNALRMAHPALPPVRWLAEDTVFHYPFLGVTMNRLGAVRACQENAERLLSQDRWVAVFPEGAYGSSKLFRDRYRLQRFGRGGYVKLALKLGIPLIPTAILGAEETNPLLARVSFGRVMGADYLPITPTFPWFGLAGLLPAPVKWRVVLGEPLDLAGYGEHSVDDALLVHRLNEQIRSNVQGLVDQARASRRSVLFG